MLISKSNFLQPMQLLLTTTTRLFDKRINSIFHTVIHQIQIKLLGRSWFPTSFCRLQSFVLVRPINKIDVT